MTRPSPPAPHRAAVLRSWSPGERGRSSRSLSIQLPSTRSRAIRSLCACCALAALALAACAPTTEPKPPLIVSADADTEPDHGEEPAVAREPADFESFLRDFQADYAASPQAVERHVSPRLGLFLLLNPGAFQRATFHTSFRELVMQADDWARLPAELTCGSPARPWSQRDGGFPKYSCELERYQTDADCSMGTISSGELREVIRLSGEYELDTPEGVAELTLHAVEVEPRITHYAFDTSHDLGLMFGQVDGTWRLLYVRKISPCSA